MFTGLVTAIGLIEQATDTPVGREFRVAALFDDLALGESIALNGVCLTVRDFAPGWFAVAAVTTTLGRTTLGDWRAGRRVNLERALRLGDRMGGHLVQGHVDGVGVVRGTRASGDAWLVDVEVPAELVPLMVPHGSITVDGVSLTVAAVHVDGLSVAVIPHTAEVTTLGLRRPGDAVNLEVDVTAKHIERLLAWHIPGPTPSTSVPATPAPGDPGAGHQGDPP